MSTQAMIGRLTAEGQVVAISLNWGAEPINTGKTLTTFYKDEARVKELIDLGNLSRLGKYINGRSGQKHSFGNQCADTCVAYHRDRGDDWNQYQFTDIGKYHRDNCGTYFFLFFEDQWYVKTIGRLPFQKLTQKMLRGELI